MGWPEQEAPTKEQGPRRGSERRELNGPSPGSESCLAQRFGYGTGFDDYGEPLSVAVKNIGEMRSDVLA